MTCRNNKLFLPSTFDFIDLMPIPMGIASLKVYGSRLNTKKLQDLPYEFDVELTKQQFDVVIEYCYNDIQLTEELYYAIKPQIELRTIMSKKYDTDLRSKSDAQIAEFVIKYKLGIGKIEVEPIKSFNYVVPEYIKFNSPALNDILHTIANLTFTTDSKSVLQIPPQLKTSKYLTKNGLRLQLGAGGLHSCEKSVAYNSNKDCTLIDADVTSYYPSIIINNKLYPKHLGPNFTKIYKAIVDERITAKRSGDKVVDATLKIVINSSFGKFGNKWSALYSNDLMLQTTITGQLALLMLIEQLEDAGIIVISTNTDGIVSKIPNKIKPVYDFICLSWQIQTGFNLEYNEYKALYSRDVNNYLAITADNKLKTKGIFVADKLSKTPAGNIIYTAVREYLQNNVAISRTIIECKDLSQFAYVRKVAGGANFKGKYIGKVCRWYWSNSPEASTLNYVKNGNKVANSDGSIPVMEIPDIFPNDIDYGRYYQEALEVLKLVGLK
jgi:hypothetical protein